MQLSAEVLGSIPSTEKSRRSSFRCSLIQQPTCVSPQGGKCGSLESCGKICLPGSGKALKTCGHTSHSSLGWAGAGARAGEAEGDGHSCTLWGPGVSRKRS